MTDAAALLQAYQLKRWRSVTWRMRLNDILDCRTPIDDLAVLYLTATRHLEAFEAAVEARRRAYAGAPAC